MAYLWQVEQERQARDAFLTCSVSAGAGWGSVYIKGKAHPLLGRNGSPPLPELQIQPPRWLLPDLRPQAGCSCWTQLSLPRAFCMVVPGYPNWEWDTAHWCGQNQVERRLLRATGSLRVPQNGTEEMVRPTHRRAHTQGVAFHPECRGRHVHLAFATRKTALIPSPF